MILRVILFLLISVFSEAVCTIPLTNESWIGYVHITDKETISDGTWIYLQAAITQFRKEKPACIVIELDTPGGELFAAQKIATALQSLDAQDHIPVIAYINTWAISAGAMITYSCRYIIAAPDASMGAATPIIQTSDGSTPAHEKEISAVRTEFANRAAFFDRNQEIARAMVDPDTFLVRRDGKIISFTEKSEQKSGDEIISIKGKLVTLTADQLRDYHIADYILPKQRGTFQNCSTLSETPLIELPEFSAFPNIPVKTFEMDAKTSFFAFLANPYVSSILFFIATTGFFLEFSVPGVTVPGLLAGISVFLLILAKFAQEAIGWFEPLCVTTGLSLVALEVFVFPTLGILLFIGALIALYGCISLIIPGVSSFQLDGTTINLAGKYVLSRLFFLFVAFITAVMFSVFIFKRLLLKSLESSGIILKTKVEPFSEISQIHVGDRAIVTAPLRPSGKIERNEILFDAMCQSRFVDTGEYVRVISVEGSRIFVEPVENT